jgi:hypothetical protein
MHKLWYRKEGVSDQPLNLVEACGLAGHPYFWDAQDAKATIRVRSITMVKNLFFISGGYFLLNDKYIRLFYCDKGSNPRIFTSGVERTSYPLPPVFINNWLSLHHNGLLA